MITPLQMTTVFTHTGIRRCCFQLSSKRPLIGLVNGMSPATVSFEMFFYSIVQFHLLVSL